MKKVTVVLAAVLALSASAALAGQAPQTGVIGSFHDITDNATYTPDPLQRVCVFCHTPHNASTAYADAPLWNRTESASANITPYVWQAPANLATDATGGNMSITQADVLTGPTRLCLTCHDGVTAVDQHGPAAGTANLSAASGTAIDSASGRAWQDLTTTHPVGFLYSEALALRGTGELVDPSTGAEFIDTVDASGVRALNTYFGTNRLAAKKISDTLYSGRVTCASCHEVHNKDNALNPLASGAPAGDARNYFLRASEERSAICLSCHIK
ncbi:MAG TPA: cytochrome C [Geobacteraceae bacterium]